MQNVTATPTSTLNVTQLLLYKETFLSLNSSADASFLVSNFGFGSNSLTFKAGPSSSGITAADGTCGVRTTMTAVTQALLHVTETKDYFEGPIEAATWIRGCFNRLHGNMSADDWGGWDRFMSMSTAFYYTDLSLTFSVLKSKGIPFAGRKYVNPIDGETMYVVFVNIPAMGVPWEFHSHHLNDTTAFHAFSSNECGAQYWMRRSVAALDTAYSQLAMELSEHTNSPMLIAIRTPSTVAHDAPRRQVFEKYLGAQPVEIIESDDAPHCVVERYEFTATESSPSSFNGVSGLPVDEHWSKIEYTFVYNPAARDGSNDVGEWCALDKYDEYVAGVHERMLGVNTGWDRYIDRHVGFVVNARDGFGSLDTVVEHLIDDGIGFHAHDDSIVNNIEYGSAWTSLAYGGLGVEIFAKTNGTYFNKTGSLSNATLPQTTGLYPLNFCSSSSD